MGAEREAAVANLESMGFERANINVAMRAAFYNPDRAVEYLLNGIPEDIQREQSQAAAVASGAAGQAAEADAPEAAAEEQAQVDDDGNVNLFEAAAQANRPGNAPRSRPANPFANATTGTPQGAAEAGFGNLDWLRNNPQFQQLRQVVQQQPHMLEPILQSVGAGNPQLAQLIGQHPDQFLQLLGEDAEDEEGALPPGTTQIAVTPEESEAIERVSFAHEYA